MELPHAILHECRRAVRSMLRSPGFTLCTIALLTISVAALTSVGSAAYELLHGPLPFGHSDRLAMVWSDLPKSGYSRAPLSGPELIDLRERSRSFTELAGISATTTTLGSPQEPRQIAIASVTSNFFSVLQAKPRLGRLFTEEDEGPGKERSIVLSWALYQSGFGGDPAVIGRKVPLNGVQAQVIGVMPPDFRMAFAPDANIPETTEIWVPLNFNLKTSTREWYVLRVIGRLRDGVAPRAASQEIAGIVSSLVHDFPAYAGSDRSMFVVGLNDDLAEPVRVPAYALLFAGVFLVLLAFVNLSGLWVARAVEQRKNQAICQAMGATVSQVRNQTLIQAVMLALLGYILGILLSKAGLAALRQVRPPSLLRIDHATLSWSVTLSVFAVVTAATVFLTLVSRAAVTPLAASDMAGSRVNTSPRYRLRAALISAQVALALLFLVCSALCTRTFLNVLNTDVGFRPEHALTFRYSLIPLGLPWNQKNATEMSLINTRLTQAVNSIPGVQAAAGISHLPFDHLPNWSVAYRSPDAPEGAQREADFRPVSPGFPAALGARLHAGRFFEETDIFGAPAVLVVDRSLADRTWPGEEAVGKKLLVATWPGTDPVPCTVIGVLETIRYRVIETHVREQIYISVRQFPVGPYAFVVRNSVDRATLTTAIRQRVRDVDARIPVWDLRPLQDYYNDASAERRFTALLLTIFATAALIVAAIGVYGLLAYIVMARQNEFGIRIALGARNRDIVGSVLRESLTWAATGIIVTGVIFVPLVTKLSSALYGIKPYDPLSWVVAGLGLLVTVAIASSIPAARAGRTDPAILMRSE